MDAFHALPDEQRQRFFQEAQAKLGLPATSIEKDFWVCWALQTLFTLPTWGDKFTFKGGTSLSKAWKLIDRFSEDIDIVVDREFLGYGGERAPETAPSKTQSRARLDGLRDECRKRIETELLPLLATALKAKLGESNWSVKIATREEDPEEPILFTYPTLFPGRAGYTNPWVKIELGARSDTEPSETPALRPYVHEAFEEILGTGTFAVRAVAARRTFWEKAMLLHEETYRPADKSRKIRLARHYFDLWSLINNGIGDQALADTGLFDRIVQHRKLFFGQTWMGDYSSLQKSTLRLMPQGEQDVFWRKDYSAMAADMFFGKPPTFDEILKTVAEFQGRCNRITG